jgi:hypothetical protein
LHLLPTRDFYDPPYKNPKGITSSNSFSIFFHQHLKAYDNVVVVTMDELPPPFVEGDYIKSVEKNVVEEDEESIIAAEPQTSAISSLPPNNTATVIAGREGHQQEGSNS